MNRMLRSEAEEFKEFSVERHAGLQAEAGWRKIRLSSSGYQRPPPRTPYLLLAIREARPPKE
jgi:hypothetical protein